MEIIQERENTEFIPLDSWSLIKYQEYLRQTEDRQRKCIKHWAKIFTPTQIDSVFGFDNYCEEARKLGLTEDIPIERMEIAFHSEKNRKAVEKFEIIPFEKYLEMSMDEKIEYLQKIKERRMSFEVSKRWGKNKWYVRDMLNHLKKKQEKLQMNNPHGVSEVSSQDKREFSLEINKKDIRFDDIIQLINGLDGIIGNQNIDVQMVIKY